jgi:hypothetical protein
MIADAHRRSGATERGVSTLREVQGMFPGEHAARAVYIQATWRNEDGDRVQAIALYRQILNHPEWTTTRWAPEAKERLTELGVDDPGGGVPEGL